MTDTDYAAGPAETSAAPETLSSAETDAVETPAESSPVKKPRARRPRRSAKSAAEIAPDAQPETATAPPSAPVAKPEKPETLGLTEHPVQAPAVAASVLPAHAAPSPVPAVAGSEAGTFETPEADAEALAEGEAAPAKRRRSRRSGRGRRRPAEGAESPAQEEAGSGEGNAAPAETPVEETSATEAPAEAQAAPETEAASEEESPRKPSRSRSRRRKPAARASAPADEASETSPDPLMDEVFVFDEDDDEPAAEASEDAAPVPRTPRKPRRRGRNKKAAVSAALDEAEEMEDDVEAEEPVPAKKGKKAAKAGPAVDRKMLVSVLPGDMVEVVLTEDGVVREYYVEMTHQVKIRGNIYKGVINNIDANLQAAFVNYGNVKNGFLQIDEVHPEYYLQPHEPTKGRKYPPIQKVLKPGQEVLVQVVKEPNGSKGAFLTTWLSLAGRFLVLTPGQEQIGISRKVEDGEERNRLRDLIRGLEPGEGLGAIVRTVSAGTSKTTLQKDLSFLKRVWKDIRKRATTEAVPSLIYQEPGLASRSVRDYLSDDVSEVWVDDADTAASIREMASLLFPRKADLVHLHEAKDKTLWERFGILNQIEQVHSREVTMPSGGRLVFDQTEALMAIDINSGRIGGKTNFESMAYRTNMEAATAIARQLRLRDIGGQIVIDFIEMRDPEHCREVEKELRNAMKGDRARHDIGKMSSFGLLQIVRQRTGSSAISISMEPCPHCKGTGQRRNMEWQAVQALRDVQRGMSAASAAGQTEYHYPVNAELGIYLLNHKRERLCLLEKEYHLRLDIRIEGVSPALPAVAAPQNPPHSGQHHGK